MDFVHDQLFDGRKLRVADHRRHVLALLAGDRVRCSFRGADVVAVLERAAGEPAIPKTIRVDQGPEFVSQGSRSVGLSCAASRSTSVGPGKPTDNAFIEILNGKFRAECLNANWFLSLDDARRKCEAWRRDYNEVRPHSAIGNKVPARFISRPANPGQPPSDEAEFSSPGGPRLGACSMMRNFPAERGPRSGASSKPAEALIAAG